MNAQGEILVIDDDRDDLFIYQSIFSDLNIPNTIKYFEYPAEVYKYLEEVPHDPFIIISDINMPLINGFQLREKMLNNHKLRGRTSPFIYVTNTGNDLDIFRAHELFATGLHRKRDDYNSQKALILDIVKNAEINITV